MLSSIVLVLAEPNNFLGEDFEFAPRLGPFLALAFFGFIIGVLGHLFSSKTMVIAGILMVFASVLLLPLALYLSGRG
jgi:sulfite exporter TauE/SafE